MSQEPIPYPFCEPTRLDVDPRYDAIREQGLVRVQLPYGEPSWLITRVADAKIAYDFRKFGRTEGLKHAIPGLHNTENIKIPTLLLHMDPPEHTRIRQLAATAFTPARIHEMKGWVQQYGDVLLDEIEAHGSGADFIAMYAHKLPVLVLARILGIPRDKAFEFKKWIDISSDASSKPEQKTEARETTLGFIRSLIAERRAKSTDDLISLLVNARDETEKLSEDEMVSLALALWNGGFKTTLWQLGTTLFTLLSQPELWRDIRDNPENMHAAINELFRWIPSFKPGRAFGFWAYEDVTFSDGQVVRKGEHILVEFTMVNRDPSVWPDPHKLDFHREKPVPHYSFTGGAHSCVGQHMARLQVRLAVQSLAQRFPNLELAIPADEVPFDPDSFMRGILRLPIKW